MIPQDQDQGLLTRQNCGVQNCGRDDYDFPRSAVDIKIIGVDSKGFIKVIEFSNKTTEKYDALEYNLNSFYGQGSPEFKLQFGVAQVGHLVACEHKGVFIRGKIIKKSEKRRKIKVKDLDDHTVVTVLGHRILKLKTEFYLIPNRVVKCKLYGLEMLIGTTYILDALTELDLLGKRLKAIVVGIEELKLTPVLRILPDESTMEDDFKCLSSRIIEWISKKIKPIEKIKMNDGAEAQVEISHYDKKGCIWLNFSDQIDLPENIVHLTEDMITRLGQPLTESNLDMLEQHQKASGIVLASYHEVYYRAKLLDFTRNPEAEVTAQFIDFGNSGLVKLARVVPVFDKESIYNKFPPLALKCHLNEVKFLSPKGVISKMIEGSLTCKISDITAQVDDDGDHPPEIELFGIQNGIKVHINHILKNQEKIYTDRLSQIKLSHMCSPSLRKWSSKELRALSKTTEEIASFVPQDENFGEFITTFDVTKMGYYTMQDYWDVEKLEDFEETMFKFYEKNRNILEKGFMKEGSYYAALINCSWVRVLILNLMDSEENDNVEVLLIDHSKIMKIYAKDLRFLDFQFYSLPYQSVFGSLIGSSSDQPIRNVLGGDKDSLSVEIVSRNSYPNIAGEVLEFKIRSWCKLNKN